MALVPWGISVHLYHRLNWIMNLAGLKHTRGAWYIFWAYWGDRSGYVLTMAKRKLRSLDQLAAQSFKATAIHNLWGREGKLPSTKSYLLTHNPFPYSLRLLPWRILPHLDMTAFDKYVNFISLFWFNCLWVLVFLTLLLPHEDSLAGHAAQQGFLKTRAYKFLSQELGWAIYSLVFWGPYNHLNSLL